MADRTLTMTLDEIKQILDLVREHELAEFELEQEGVKLRVRKKGQDAAPAVMVSPAQLPIPVLTAGTAAAPTAAPFVSVGDTVRKNQVLCLIEAMKLMNEIVSEYDGEIVQIFVENGQPVQYGERLFAVRAR